MKKECLAAQIENFLAENDSAYGYSVGVKDGWQDREHAVQSIEKMLLTGDREWLNDAFSGLQQERPELSKDIDQLWQNISDHEPLTVRKFIEQHPGETLDMMTPGGYVYLTPEKAQLMLSGQGVKGNPGESGYDMEIPAKELLEQKILSANFSDGNWHLLCSDIDPQKKTTHAKISLHERVASLEQRIADQNERKKNKQMCAVSEQGKPTEGR